MHVIEEPRDGDILISPNASMRNFKYQQLINFNLEPDCVNKGKPKICKFMRVFSDIERYLYFILQYN